RWKDSTRPYVLYSTRRLVNLCFKLLKSVIRNGYKANHVGHCTGFPSSLRTALPLIHRLECPPLLGVLRRNPPLVDLLTNAGAIILGRTNLSELMDCKGRGMMAGWSAVGGRRVSVYVNGGINRDDRHAGHSSPEGTSTGSAVSMSAGFAPVAIGTETSGSLIESALRTALYTIKPTVNLISQQGLVPAKSPYDVAAFLDAMTERDQENSYTKANLRLGALNPADWRKEPEACWPHPDANAQMDAELAKAYHATSSHCAKLVPDLFLNKSNMSIDEHDAYGVPIRKDLESSGVGSIEELIEFNKIHHEQELPSNHPNQYVLKMDVAYPFSVGDVTYERCLAYLRLVARNQALDHALQQNEIDIIIGSGESELASIAAAAGQLSNRTKIPFYTNAIAHNIGYPIGTTPLPYLDLNGRQFGVFVLAAANQESKILETMSAWHSTFPGRQLNTGSFRHRKGYLSHK
ncbi:unnamed protein product, partial [Clonostachys rosea]